MGEGKLLLTLSAPDRAQIRVRCDSVRFAVPDSADGKIPGGSVGIRRGHADALMTVADGDVLAFSDGGQVLRCRVEDGVAAVGADGVTVLAARLAPDGEERGAPERAKR